MKSIFTCLLIFAWYFSYAQSSGYGLIFSQMPTHWDEGIPLGNGWLGALVWQKNDKLRLSIDRVDLWDDRPMAEINQLKFNWVMEQVAKKNYAPVQKVGDDPYSNYPAPSKIPGAAIEFDMRPLGHVLKDTLDIQKAVNTITFDSGITFTTYVHAIKKAGYFSFDGISNQSVVPALIGPAYYSLQKKGTKESGNSLTRLGYGKATMIKRSGQIIFHQPTYGKNYYEVLVQWKRTGGRLSGIWTISNGSPVKTVKSDWPGHLNWWKSYWDKSSVSMPDKMLQRQYMLDMYKFGCVSRADTPPISLQAIWTADDGGLPPWKGDFHSDLNTEMSYWPGYTANHLDLTTSLTNWLWKVKGENKRWTKRYFNVTGLNVPGVSTISGKPMGGWIQYAMSPTTGAWLAHHFYLQWKYSMDDQFLHSRCYPYLSEVATYINNMLVRDQQTGTYQLPLSSSPEYNQNNLGAWFHHNTNYDLSLIHNLYLRYAEVAKASGHPSLSILKKEKKIAGLDFNASGLTIAPGTDLRISHRHLSHLMAIYPLALLNKDNSAEMELMKNSIKTLEIQGTRIWYGFTFPWAATVYAQMGQGDEVLSNLKKFAENFCSSNSFNLNGDQKGGQYSDYTDRPFTLETNFGFAEGIHQLLLQSEHGYLDVFPALPQKWNDVSFKNLRGQGAFLVSASSIKGRTQEIRILSETGGLCRLRNPFKSVVASGIDQRKMKQVENGILEFETTIGQVIIFREAIKNI